MRNVWSPAAPTQDELDEYERQRAALRPPTWEVGPPPEANIPSQEMGPPDESTLAAAPVAPPRPSPAPWELGDEWSAADPEAAIRVPALPVGQQVVDRRQTAASADVTPPSPVARAAQQPIQPQDLPQYDPGPKPGLGSAIGNLIRQGGALGANIFMAKGGKGDREATLQAIQDGNQQIRRVTDQAAVDSKQFARNSNWAQRQAHQDQRQAHQDAAAGQDRERRIAREDKADARMEAAARLSEAARDPQSQKNQIFRSSIQKEYPEIWEGLTPEQQANLTIEDAHALGPAIQGEQRERETQQKLDAESRSEARQRRLIDYRRKPRGAGGGGYSSQPGQDQEVIAAITESFQGKVPPEVAARVKLAQAIRDPQKRAAKLDQILHQAGQQASSAKHAEAKTQEADFKETREYQNKMEGLRNARRTVVNLRKALKNYTKAGPDGKMQHAGDDIPGYGRFASHLPDVAISNEGQELRSMVRDYVSQLVLARSGKAATDTERRYLESVLGVSPGMSEEQLVAALERMEAMNAETEKDLSAAYNAARAARDANRPGATRETDPEDEFERIE